jgi:hypothetical protein
MNRIHAIMASFFLFAAIPACAPAASANSSEAQAQAALDRLEKVREKVFAEPPGQGPFVGVSLFAMLSRQTADMRLKALFSRAAQDQFYRLAIQQLALGADWAIAIDPAASKELGQRLLARMGQIDEANHSWLKADLAANGWYRISTSKEADIAAWLMVQHADRDLPFQKEVLSMLEPLVRLGETNSGNYALLFDRVAVNEGHPQRYGSQGSCTGPKQWSPRDTEEPDGVDARREQVGLPSLAAYIAQISRACP